jgi:hypothetical protein
MATISQALAIAAQHHSCCEKSRTVNSPSFRNCPQKVINCEYPPDVARYRNSTNPHKRWVSIFTQLDAVIAHELDHFFAE